MGCEDWRLRVREKMKRVLMLMLRRVGVRWLGGRSRLCGVRGPVLLEFGLLAEWIDFGTISVCNPMRVRRSLSIHEVYCTSSSCLRARLVMIRSQQLSKVLWVIPRPACSRFSFHILDPSLFTWVLQLYGRHRSHDIVNSIAVLFPIS